MKQPLLLSAVATAFLLLWTLTTKVQAFIPYESSASKSKLLRRGLSRDVILHAEASNSNPLEDITSTSSRSTSIGKPSGRSCRARDLILSLVEEDQCFTSDTGARAFGDVCAVDIVYEDRFESQPKVGKTEVTSHMLDKVAQRKGRGGFRIDKISDGNRACGFAWTWTCGDEEGLRGTTFVELNDNGEIQYVQEIPEPIFKPGNLTKDLLKAVTGGAEPKVPVGYEKKTPKTASEIAKYLYVDLQGAEQKDGLEELLRFIDDGIIYRDFNFEDVLRSPMEVRAFVEDFSFPGIEFRPTRFDDGVDTTCFTWEVILDGAEDTIKGMSLYELDPESRKIVYIRDVPESAIKPPVLGKLARQLRPGMGVFQGVPLGSRPGGM